MLIRILSSDWSISIQVPSKLEKNRMHRKKTVTRTNEMIEDLIDFIEIHPIVAFEVIYEPMLTSF
jgi:hypothetical protein